MRLVFSVPSGFHLRELVLPLQPWLESDPAIEQVTIITPGAPWKHQLFPRFSSRFTFHSPLATAALYKQYFNETKSDLVITNTSGLDALDVPFLQGAQQAGRQTLTFVASWDNVWKMERLKHQGQPQVLADRIVVWNTIMRDHLQRIFPAKTASVTVLGAPRFDYFWHHDRIPSSGTLRQALGVPAEGALVHIATTELYPADYIVRSLTQAHRAVQLTRPFHLYLSVHPGGNLERHAAYTKGQDTTVGYSFGRQNHAPHPAFRYNPSLDDIYRSVALFKHSDVLINHSSTVALESLVAQVPVINVKYGRRFDWWHWYRSMVYRDFKQHYHDLVSDGATAVVGNERQLIAALNQALQNKNERQAERTKTIKKILTLTDGTASQKMFDLIKQLAG